MKKLKGIFIISTILIISLTFIVTLVLNNINKKNKINIAVSDDSSGFVINYLTSSKKNINLNVKKDLKSHKIIDCCSNTLSMGLSSKSLDMALMCPHSAKILIDKDNNFEILGPCILNTNVFLLNSKRVKSIGISDGREYQKAKIYKKFGEDIKIVPMIAPSLSYSLEKKNVDGILVDALKGILIQNKNYEFMPLENEITYVLVVNKEFKKDKKFKLFLKEFNKSLEELNKSQTLINEINKLKNIKNLRKGIENWKKLKIKFVPITIK